MTMPPSLKLALSAMTRRSQRQRERLALVSHLALSKLRESTKKPKTVEALQRDPMDELSTIVGSCSCRSWPAQLKQLQEAGQAANHDSRSCRRCDFCGCTRLGSLCVQPNNRNESNRRLTRQVQIIIAGATLHLSAAAIGAFVSASF